ncbi:hypothetical protein GTP45_05790 [Pseudoduganella sp. FT55W]|uniref:Lipoprotein n=1 Tax=Duganella rivi TaxID=2666083 RepID=A0A7X4GPM0_9BURK|nr:hypothetical protein [Duganella rivi]MYM66347.1 hypothetical protein [Duganella rivi]
MHRILPLACLLLSGCALTWVSPDGTRNVLGLAHVSVPPAIAPAATGADWIRVRSVGLAFSRTPLGSALDIGYSDNTLAGIHQHSCVRIEPPFTLSGEEHASNLPAR